MDRRTGYRLLWENNNDNETDERVGNLENFSFSMKFLTDRCVWLTYVCVSHLKFIKTIRHFSNHVTIDIMYTQYIIGIKYTGYDIIINSCTTSLLFIFT